MEPIDLDNLTDAEILAAGCERNARVEIHKHTGDATIPVARARMMCMDEERLYLDEPQTIGKQVEMGKGTAVDAFFSLGDGLFTFSTTVASMNCRVRLNGAKTLIGMALDIPRTIKQGQRRSRYRTSLAMQTPIKVSMHQASSDLGSSPIDADRVEGRLVDASEGGFGVMLDFDRPLKYKLYEKWVVQFHIPGEPDLTLLGCELRQIRTIREGESMKLGLLALPWPDQRAMRSQMLPLTKYLTSVERRLLKRVS